MASITVVTPAQLTRYDKSAQARQFKVDAKTLQDAKDYADSKVGSLDSLSTTAKDSTVAAINEVFEKVSESTTGGVISIDSSITTEGMAKSYTIKQGTTTIGTIDVPKDMVVSSGELKTLAEADDAGHIAGTYLVLTLTNATSDKVWVNLDGLVDTYTAAQSATQIQVAVDPSTREISATIVAGSVTATEIAANAITTEKIADKNVTIDKLSDSVQESLRKADSAVHAVTESTTNGSIYVDGSDVSVHGLANGAFTEISECSDEDIDAIFASPEGE